MKFPVIVSDKNPICLIGGARIATQVFHQAQTLANTLVAVDSGADFLLQQALVPQAVIGDLDSLSARARDTFADRLYHISEQATTDFEKALSRVTAPCVIALGFTGGRLDHLLSVLGVMARHPQPPVVLLDEDDASFMAGPGMMSFSLEKGTRISVMPVGRAEAVSLAGVVWSFDNQTMTQDGFTSPSNAALGGEVQLSSRAPVLVTLPREQLAVAVTAAVHAR